MLKHNLFAFLVLFLFFRSSTAGSSSVPISNISWSYNPNPNAGGFNIFLARPTNTSITIGLISLLPATIQASFDYWTTAKIFKLSSSPQTLNQYVPATFEITNLLPNTNYSYQIHYTLNGVDSYSSEYYFSTAKNKGSSFTFAVEADPHFDDSTDLSVYKSTLASVLSQKPDFMISLGDFLMTDMLSSITYDSVKNRTILMREYYDLITRNVPLMILLGNHESEFSRSRSNTTSISTDLRRTYMPNPEANSFYSGNTDGSENYYAFTWGDALFVGLDCFRYAPSFQGWGMTLGETQYKWFRSTLENSNATFKFVFSHNLVGGPTENRGGVENAKLYEWGGYEADGKNYTFDTYRPGWGKPIHKVMVDTGVTVWFHGHDHLYAHQILDGVTYQAVPQPGRASIGKNILTSYASKYGYVTGTILGTGGSMVVNVSQNQVTVKFVTYQGTVADSYTFNH